METKEMTLRKTLTYLKMLDHAFQELNTIWQDQDNVDLNDFLTDMYPFTESFDQVAVDVREWVRYFSVIALGPETDSEERENLIQKLQNTQHLFWVDPGHGWLQVKYDDLITLGVLDKISAYSYRGNEIAYLEEDIDAGIYIDALFGPHKDRPKEEQAKFIFWRDSLIQTQWREKDIFIRRLPSIKR